MPGEPAAQLAHIEEAPNPDALKRLWQPVHQDWIDWGTSLPDDAGWSKIVPHQDSRGNFYELPAWQILMHAVNHGSYHRGQITRMMREEGITPPATDLVIYTPSVTPAVLSAGALFKSLSRTGLGPSPGESK